MAVSRAVMAGVRFGFGLTPDLRPDGDPDALLDQLKLAQDEKLLFPQEGVETRRKRIRQYRSVRQDLTQRIRDGEALGAQEKALNRDVTARFEADVSARIAQAAGSPFGFQERLASFWLNHFTTSAGKSTEMRLIVPLYEAEAIRPNLSGRFADLLKAVSLHPAMLVFLDQTQSAGPDSRMAERRGTGGVNENFGREVMELHTLGVNSGYTQADVRQLALLFTGLVFNRDEVQAGFDPNRAQPGTFKVMGKLYKRGEGVFDVSEEALEDLASDERTMRHVSTQLYTHFISETPDAETIAAMVKAWKAKDGDLRAVYRAMLTSKAAWEEPGQKFKKPFDYIVSSLRAAGLTQPEDLFNSEDKPRGAFDLPDVEPQRLAMAEPDDDENRKGMEGKDGGEDMKARPKAKRSLARQAGQMIAALGEPVWRPSDAAGFKDQSAYWFNPAQLSMRIEWARRLARRIPGKPDPRQFAHDALLDLARDDTLQLVSRAPSREAGLMLALVSPEFNRR